MTDAQLLRRYRSELGAIRDRMEHTVARMKLTENAPGAAHPVRYKLEQAAYEVEIACETITDAMRDAKKENAPHVR